MDKTKRVDELLEESGAQLVRDGVHQVWSLPNGQIFVRAKTPSDRRATQNQLCDLRKALGIVNQGNQEGIKRRKRPRQPRKTTHREHIQPTPFNSSLADALRLAGAREDVLEHQIEQMGKVIIDLHRQLNILEQACDALVVKDIQTEQFLHQCLWCRLRRWWAAR